MDDIILGIWDGHDSGVAVVKGNEILFAINEERLSRRKSDIAFPTMSIKKALEYLELDPGNIRTIAYSTNDLAKTVTRLVPGLKEKYYNLRRRKSVKPHFVDSKKRLKYFLTLFSSNAVLELLNKKYMTYKLRNLGFKDFNLLSFDHHYCHAVSAAFLSGFDNALIATFDGIGDGLSATMSLYDGNSLKRINEYNGRNSFGFFFEHITNLLNMRELEDEGKVMALADFAYKVGDDKNPFMQLVKCNNEKVYFKYGVWKTFRKIRNILWNYPPEQVAYMGQRTLEKRIMQLLSYLMKKYNCNNIGLSGGVVSNIKLNMKVRELPGVKRIFVFPHMGDGGLALGAAIAANNKISGIKNYNFKNMFLGPGYTDTKIENILESTDLKYQIITDIGKKAATLISNGEILLWYQERMELGPRALGGRSILALPNSESIKDQLNLLLKKRVWYQPFCPSMLKSDAKKYLIGFEDDNPNMTMAYKISEANSNEFRAVINIDKSCRPQIVPDDFDHPFRNLLLEIKKRTGFGVVLNTSFNIHGEPIVEKPEDALKVMKEHDFRYLVINNYLIEK